MANAPVLPAGAKDGGRVAGGSLVAGAPGTGTMGAWGAGREGAIGAGAPGVVRGSAGPVGAAGAGWLGWASCPGWGIGCPSACGGTPCGWP